MFGFSLVPTAAIFIDGVFKGNKRGIGCKLTAVFIFVNICRDKFECCPGEFSGFPKEFSLCVGVDGIAGHLTVGNRIADGDLYIGDRVVLSVYHFPFDLVISMWAAVFFYLTSPIIIRIGTDNGGAFEETITEVAFKKEDLTGGNGEWNYGNAQKNVTIKMKQAVENKE